MKTFLQRKGRLNLLVPLFMLSMISPLHAQWVQTNGPYGGVVKCFAVSGTNIFAGTSVGVYLSTNNGTSWTQVNNGLTNTNVVSLAVSGTNIFAGTFDGGVFLSTNNGTSWTQVNNGLTNTGVSSLAVSGTNIFAGTSVGVYLSTNNGTSWTQVNNGLKNTDVRSLVVSGTNLFAGTYGGGVWRRPVSEMTSVESYSTDLPTDFGLEQNYPNPFNPTTNIMYTVPNKEYVNLTVYNILGEKIATLVDEEKAPGKYTVTFDGSRLPSGVFFYRLHAGKFNETREMVLVK